MSDINLLHIYPQHTWHGNAFIVGNRKALELLRDAITNALSDGKGGTPEGEDCLFASDGEGYQVLVVLNDADWQGSEWTKLANHYYTDPPEFDDQTEISPYDLWENIKGDQS